MGIRLFLKEKDGSGRLLDLDETSVIIGRSADCEVVLADKRASRRHCRLSLTPQGALLEDLGSANGTLVAGEPITKKLLGPGDRFRIGKTRLTFDPSAAAESETPEPASASSAGSGDPSEGTRRRERVDSSGVTVPGDAVEDGSGPADESAIATLKGVAGPLRGQDVPIDTLPFTIGRAPGSDLRLKDSRISSSHAQLVREGSDLVIEDLESKNGILVDGHKVDRGVLVTGSRIVLGGSVFVSSVPGTAPRSLTAPPGPAGTGGDRGEEMISAKIDVEDYFAGDRIQQPLFVAALLVIVGLISFFAIDVARRLLLRPEVDPPSRENAVANWSFEAELPEGPQAAAAAVRIPGWRRLDPDRGRLELTSEHAQYPGLRALRVIATGGGELCGAVQEDLISVGPSEEVSLEGYVASEGAFFAGFLVEWIQDTGQEETIIDRSFSECTQGRSASLNVFETFAVPSGCNYARLACIVYGQGGAGVFDRVSWTPRQSELDEEVAEIASQEVTLSARVEDRNLEVTLLRQGDQEVRGGGRRIFSSVWAGLDEESDPLLFGPRLALATIESGDRGAYRLLTSVPDVTDENWVTVEADARSDGAGVTIDWRAVSDRSGAAPPSLLAYFRLSRPDVPVMIHTARGSRVKTIEEIREEQEVEEIVFGANRDRTSMLFTSPVELAAKADRVLEGSWILSARAASSEVGIRLVPGARRERQAARRMLREAIQLHQEGRIAEARETLSVLQKLYPAQESEVTQSQALLTEWRRESRKLLESFEQTAEELKKSPSPVIFETLLSRADQLLAKYQNTVEAEELRRQVGELKAFWSSLPEDRAEKAAQEMLEKARGYSQAGQYGLAELYLRLILDQAPEGPLAEQCARRLESIEKARDARVERILLRR